MKNKLIDLNDHLFLQLERINDEDITGDDLKKEIARSQAVTNIAKAVVANATLALSAERLKREYGPGQHALPAMIEN